MSQQKKRRQQRIRAKIRGTGEKPRLTVFRSNSAIYVQAIDDEKRQTIISASEKDVVKKEEKLLKTQTARLVGKLIAERLVAKKVKAVVFDKGSYRYHGRVRELAEGAREGGLQF